MEGEFTFTLNNPLTEEDWDKITDVDFDYTNAITFHTKHGKEVEFAKVVRCKNCKYSYVFEPWEGINASRYCKEFKNHYGDCDMCVEDDDFCSHGERNVSNRSKSDEEKHCVLGKKVRENEDGSVTFNLTKEGQDFFKKLEMNTNGYTNPAKTVKVDPLPTKRGYSG